MKFTTAIIIFGVLILISRLLSGYSRKIKRQNWNKKQITSQNKKVFISSKNDKDINIVSKSEYYKCPLMNKSEYSLFQRLTAYLNKYHSEQGIRLFPQVAMGEFIRSTNNDAFYLINNKRVDFVIINKVGEAILVIEYQGSGHYQKNAAERDAIKKEACRKAGIEYIEFKENYNHLEFGIVSKILNSANNIN